jgi:hypothetical protein
VAGAAGAEASALCWGCIINSILLPLLLLFAVKLSCCWRLPPGLKQDLEETPPLLIIIIFLDEEACCRNRRAFHPSDSVYTNGRQSERHNQIQS